MVDRGRGVAKLTIDVHTNFEKIVKIILHSIKLEYVGMKAFEPLTLDPPPIF